MFQNITKVVKNINEASEEKGKTFYYRQLGFIERFRM